MVEVKVDLGFSVRLSVFFCCLVVYSSLALTTSLLTIALDNLFIVAELISTVRHIRSTHDDAAYLTSLESKTGRRYLVRQI